MTTRAIVPNADGEGSLGTSTTKWGAVYSSDPAAGDNSGQVPTTAWVQSLVATVKNEVLQQIFPVGSIYTSLTDSRNPNAILGFGTWAAIAGGTALISAGTCKDEDGTSRTYTAGKTYGANYSQISVDEIKKVEGYIAFHNQDNGTVVQSAGGVFSVSKLQNNMYHYYDKAVGANSYGEVNFSLGKNCYHCNISKSVCCYSWRRQA